MKKTTAKQLEFQVREYLNGYMSYEALLGYIVALFNNSLLTINEVAMLLDAIEKDRG